MPFTNTNDTEIFVTYCETDESVMLTLINKMQVGLVKG